jgi:hypothetical protein
VGLAELGGHHHRRDPGGEDRAGPRDRRAAGIGVVVPDEVAAVQREDTEGRARLEAFIAGSEER